MDLSVASGIIANLSAAKDIALSLIDVRDTQKLATIQSHLTERLINAQSQTAELMAKMLEATGRIGELEKQVRELERQHTERDRYELAEIASGRDLAYRLKTPSALSERQGEPSHFLCQPCFDKGVKAILTKVETYGTDIFNCPICKAQFRGSHRKS